ncbi:MAG: DUF1015 domain-containing protein, partial [Oscillospiraceae bacterium]|nr:DUF1015 domain-containing protein [Oscillospiraceae bacterium]
ARYGLAELVNIHEPSLVFEPIHRVIFGTNTETCFEEAAVFFEGLKGAGGTEHTILLVCGGKTGKIAVEGLTFGALIAAAQRFCEAYSAAHGGAIDYIHGDDTAREMSGKRGCTGLLLPAMDKSALFPSIMESGVFPAKSFSIGPARDKRYYLECRKIK